MGTPHNVDIEILDHDTGLWIKVNRLERITKTKLKPFKFLFWTFEAEHVVSVESNEDFRRRMKMECLNHNNGVGVRAIHTYSCPDGCSHSFTIWKNHVWLNEY